MARGYNALGDILRTTADGADLNTIWDEHQATLQIQNDKQASLAALFSFDTTLASEYLAQGFGGSDFEKSSEYGVPQSLRSTGELVQVGYDFDWFDLAARYTWRFMAEASAAQIASIHGDALAADNRLVFNKIMKRIFDPVSRVNREGAPVHGFWNGTGTAPPNSPDGDTFFSTHSHFHTTGSTSLASSEVDDLVETVAHHGYGLRANGDRIIVLANPEQADVIAGYRVATGAKFDAIPTTDAPAFITSETIEGDRPPGTFNGLTVACAYGDTWVVSERRIPAGYVVALATGGPNSLRNPLGFRQHPLANLRGLVQIPGATQNYPLLDSYYTRAFGVGVRARGAGAVLQVTAGSTYTPPAAFAA